MSYVISAPDALVAAATDTAGIGSALSAANAAAAGPTTQIAAAAADEVSASVAALFGTFAEEFQALGAQAADFHSWFVQTLVQSAGLYAIADTANASPLRNLAREVLSILNLPAGGSTGGTSTGGSPGTGGGTSTGGSPGTGGGTGTGGTGTGGSTGTGGGGTVISTQYGTTTIGNAYVVQNNAWNNPNGQSINVTSTGFSIATENGSAPTNGAPLGYPSIYDGFHYGTGSPGTNLPMQLSNIQTATSSIDYTYPSNGTYDASYDIWLNPTPITNGVNQQEIMIWFNHVGPIQPVGSVVGNATIDGRSFVVWEGGNGSNNVVSYVASSPMNSWNDFNVLGFVDNTETLEPVTNSWYLTSIQAGFEPWNGSVGASVNSFSASVNGVS
jgi:hypothetical protein